MRLPYGHALGRSHEMDAGGVADLQTDVMRFMAILAICLVVIFALVQSIPLAPVQTAIVEPPPVVAPLPEPVAEQPLAPVPEPVAIPAPEPAPAPIELVRPAALLPKPVNEPVPIANEPVLQPTTPAPERVGFTLQFESDLALKRLIERDIVGLYAIADSTSMRLNFNGERMSFWEASTPNQFHEMDRGTVPSDVFRALLRTAALDPTAVKWGVTLPAGMQEQLTDLLDSAAGGALIIGANGQLRLEP